MKHIVMFSGGVNSWAAAKRVAAECGVADMVLLFADTLIEDEDLYRFVEQAAANVGVLLTRVADGRTPWQVFKDERMLGSSRVDPCSKILKRKILNDWYKERYGPNECVVYFGLDWTESHRMNGRGDKPGVRKRLLPYVAEAPLCKRPLLSKRQIHEWLANEGIELPRLYKLGFPHNNCGGFCIKAGKAQFRHALRTMPARFAKWAAAEEDVRQHIGRSDISILRDRDGGCLPLAEFAAREQNRPIGMGLDCGPKLSDDEDDWGGCGCAVD